MLSESAKKLLVALSDGGGGRGSTVNCRLQALGLYIFARGFRSALDCKTVRIFAYSSTREQSNKRSGKKLKTERLKTLTPRFTDFFTDFEKKNRLFCSLGALINRGAYIRGGL